MKQHFNPVLTDNHCIKPPIVADDGGGIFAVFFKNYQKARPNVPFRYGRVSTDIKSRKSIVISRELAIKALKPGTTVVTKLNQGNTRNFFHGAQRNNHVVIDCGALFLWFVSFGEAKEMNKMNRYGTMRIPLMEPG